MTLSVVAIEPSTGIREMAQQYAQGDPIHWLSETLPNLSRVFSLQVNVDLLLLFLRFHSNHLIVKNFK